MARYSKIFFVFIILVLSLWLIPWFYHFMTAQPIRNPFARFRRPPAGQPERNKTNSAKNRIDQFHFQTIRFGHK